MFDIKMVTTDKNNRRSGLGTDLLRRSVQLAASLGYKVRTGMSKDRGEDAFPPSIGSHLMLASPPTSSSSSNSFNSFNSSNYSNPHPLPELQ